MMTKLFAMCKFLSVKKEYSVEEWTDAVLTFQRQGQEVCQIVQNYVILLQVHSFWVELLELTRYGLPLHLLCQHYHRWLTHLGPTIFDLQNQGLERSHTSMSILLTHMSAQCLVGDKKCIGFETQHPTKASPSGGGEAVVTSLERLGEHSAARLLDSVGKLRDVVNEVVQA